MSKLIPKSEQDQEYEYSKFVTYLTKGYNRTEICEKLALDIRSHRYEVLYDRFQEEIQDETKSKSPLRLFSEYIANQKQLIRDLEAIKASCDQGDGIFTDKKNYVGACKTQSDIYDKIINTGQKLGIINKTADKIELINGMDPRDMNDNEIKKAAEENIQKIKNLISNNKKDVSGKVIAFTPENFKKEKTTVE